MPRDVYNADMAIRLSKIKTLGTKTLGTKTLGKRNVFGIQTDPRKVKIARLEMARWLKKHPKGATF